MSRRQGKECRWQKVVVVALDHSAIGVTSVAFEHILCFISNQGVTQDLETGGQN